MLVGCRSTSQHRFGSPFSSKVVVCGHCLVTLPLTINETLKWFSSVTAYLNAGVILVVPSDRYLISLFPYLHTSFPNKPYGFCGR